MAHFIVGKLGDIKNDQARWLIITQGKFELTKWHELAQEWFTLKPRQSPQVDAACMLRKGLPRAFPGLEEVKGESVKEGTMYKSRVFIVPPGLVNDVYSHMGMAPASPVTSLLYHQNSTAPQMSHAMTNSHHVDPPLQPVPYTSTSQPSVDAYGLHHGLSDGIENSGGVGIHSSLQLKVVPDSSPLKGGGQMVLVFNNTLPLGNKFVIFFSCKSAISVHTTQLNDRVLCTLIPRYDIPETILLHVSCEGCGVLAQAEFTYYATAPY